MTPARMVAKAAEVDRFDVGRYGGVMAALVGVVFALAADVRRAHPLVGPLHAEVSRVGPALVMVQGFVPPTWTLREMQDTMLDQLGQYGSVEDDVALYVQEEGLDPECILDSQAYALREAVADRWEPPEPGPDPDTAYELWRDER